MTSDFATPTTTTTPDSVPVEAPVLWYRDPISCLQSTFASVLDRAGVNPLFALGAGWEFLYVPDDVRSEEFYYPCRHEGDLGRSLFPHHDVSSSWWCPADPDDPLREIREAMTEGRLVIAAVDNFYLPFRPAFGDVHAAHLLVVYGLDERRGLVHVSDAMPPAFQGPIPLDDFLNSWGSANPQDHQDAFFSDSEISRRCLSVSVGSLGGAGADPGPEQLAGWLRGNLERFDDPGMVAGLGGLAGLDGCLGELTLRAQAGEVRALQELYPFGWGMQAQAALHGELLRDRGAAWRSPALAGAGRAVESVAHAWTPLRITAAHGLDDPAAAADDLRRHAGVLRWRHTEAIEAVRRALDEL
ncbi:BtrH N-terminal domain-containing protein [Streptomyces sp. NBC_00252]|uniref:BtrH N-terminal domain-containing protein n=1 Tax=Streptomyces sp. NBC_00252 TaxID=2975691 RepID=UPI002E2B611A|nr:BtrH N-terminal domain-containing protein [Streptomyces sp. NBC_00252]